MNEINSIPDPIVVNPVDQTFILGEGSVIAASHKIDFTDRVELGKRVIVGGRNSSFWTHNRQMTEPIIVGDYSYLGSEIRMTPGSAIPAKCIVGIGAVVTKKFEGEYKLIAGVPAKIAKELDEDGRFLTEYKTRADRYLAQVAALLGESDAAERHFGTALEMDRRMGSVVHVAETLAAHALAVQPTDPTRARDLAAQARALAEPIGQVRVLRRLERIRAAGPAQLTPREMEVLALLAHGLSNREIGARLFISSNTTANHIRSILMKTGTANRTQAARYATEHELV